MLVDHDAVVDGEAGRLRELDRGPDSDPDDDQVVIRGDTDTREFVAFWLSSGRVLAGMNVNVWDVTDPIKALILSRRAVDPVRLADPSVPLTDLLD